MTSVPATIASNESAWEGLLQELSPEGAERLRAVFESEEPSISRAVADPTILKIADALQVARAAVKRDAHLDSKLVHRMNDLANGAPSRMVESEIARILAILDEISDCRRLAIQLLKFLKLPNPYQRAKVVKLIARASQNPGWAEKILADPDPRVRSNLIEGILLRNGTQIETLLRKAAEDPHHRVSTTALWRLCEAGDEPSCEHLRRLAVEGDDAHRRAAQWALGKLEQSKPAIPTEPTSPEPTSTEPTPAESQ